MASFATMFSFAGIVVLAIAVIILAIWISRLSSKIKRLTDAMMMDPTQARRQMASQGYAAAPRNPAGQYGYEGNMQPLQQARPAQQTAAYAPQQQVERQQAAPAARQQAVQQPVQKQVQQPVQQQPRQQAMQQPRQQAYTETSSGMRVAASNGNNAAAYQAEDDEFFENYRDRGNGGQQSKGRGKPSIPFGADKNVMDRRRESYAGSAADLDYEPDSIDFTRVQGYRNLYR